MICWTPHRPKAALAARVISRLLTPMLRISNLTALVAGLALFIATTSLAAQTETSDYRKVDLHGWVILVSPDYAGDDARLDRALGEVDRQLSNIAAALPEPALSKVRQTVFWLEYRADDPKRSVYHRSAGWLRKNGFNPDKAKGIEIDAGIYTREETAPWSLLHELAHAYYDVVLNRQADALDAAYTAAIGSGDYDRVLRNTGRRQRAYAMTNPSEYFAELSEAYFGENDFEPFTRDALRTFDPQGYDSVRDLWARP